MPREILVPDVNEGGERAPMAAAMALAAPENGRIVLLVTIDVPAPMASDWGAMSYDLYAHLHKEAHARANARADALRARYAHADAPVEVRVAEAVSVHAPYTAALHARYADLTILPTLGEHEPERMLVHDYFHTLLLQSGGPVMTVPAATPSLPPKRVLVAWKPTREASRAVRDAMPYLRDAAHVEIVVVDPKTGEVGHGDEPGADIAAHLARHGLDVRVSSRERKNFSVAYSLLEHARETGADLIVAGGYGHSRFRESVLGGTTRELLGTTHVPVLFSH